MKKNSSSQKLPKIISIVGYKNTGKTTLIYKLIKEFKSKNLKTAVIKNSHAESFDKENTDTKKLIEVSDVVVGRAKNETFLNFQEQLSFNKIVSCLKSDIILVEGMKKYNFFPRVIVFNEDTKEDLSKLIPELAICSYGTKKIKGLKNIKSIKTLSDTIIKKAFLLPNLNCGDCKQNCFEMAKQIVAGKKTLKDCSALNSSITIKINNKKVFSNRFVEKVFKEMIVAMLKNLKGYEEGDIEISLNT